MRVWPARLHTGNHFIRGMGAGKERILKSHLSRGWCFTVPGVHTVICTSVGVICDTFGGGGGGGGPTVLCWYRSRNTDIHFTFKWHIMSHCAHILKLNCLLGFLTSCLETELDSATACFESIPLLASIPTTGFPELRTRIWSFSLLTQKDHAPVLCPLNGSTVRAVFNLLQQAIHHDSLQSRGGVAT